MAGDKKKMALDFAGALADYSAAITAKPTLYQAWQNRGECQMNLGFYDLAIQDFNEAIALNPNFSVSYYNIGLCYVKLKKYAEGLLYIEKACSADTSINGNIALAECYFYTGKNNLAIKHFDLALTTMPDSIGLLLGRGLAHYQLGNILACKSDLNNYLIKGGSNSVASRQLGLTYLRMADSTSMLDSSLIFLEQYKTKAVGLDLEASKALTLGYLTRGKMLMRGAKEIEALADFSKAIELDPANAEAYYQRGKIMISLGQKIEGCLDLQNALRNGNVNAQKLIAIYCEEVL